MKDSFDYIWELLSPKAEYANRKKACYTLWLSIPMEERRKIYLEVCVPEPDLSGYPYIDRHPDDYPVVLTDEMIVLMGDLDEDERPEEPMSEPEYV